MTKDNKKHQWARFEKQLQEIPPDDWECFAPRSRVQGKGDREIYKLFVRAYSNNRVRPHWWLFENIIDRVPASYPEEYYAKVDDTLLVRGPLEFLRDIHAGASSAALTKALQLIHARLAEFSGS
jgi:hypothetical protein